MTFELLPGGAGSYTVLVDAVSLSVISTGAVINYVALIIVYTSPTSIHIDCSRSPFQNIGCYRFLRQRLARQADDFSGGLVRCAAARPIGGGVGRGGRV